MNSKDAKEAVERTLELNRLQFKIAELEKELSQLREEQLHHCESCDNLMQHDCFTLWFCPALGVVNPLRDGCSRWKEREED